MYQGQLYSNTNPAQEGPSFNIQVTSKKGNRFADTSIKFKGQLSATGEAIIGTYQSKGTSPDKGSCFFVVEFDP